MLLSVNGFLLRLFPMKKRYAYIALIVLLVFKTMLFSDIIGQNNRILFRSNASEPANMILNETGLGVGITPSSNLHVKGNAILDSLAIGSGQTSSANLQLNGSIGYSVKTIFPTDSPYAMNETTMLLLDTSSGNIVLTLPYAGNLNGRIYSLKKLSSNGDVFVYGDDLIDHSARLTMPESASILASAEMMSDGINWWVLSMSDNVEVHSNYEAYYDMHSDFTTTENNIARESDPTITAAGNFANVNTTTSPVQLIDYSTGKDLHAKINFVINNARNFWINGAESIGGDALALFGNKIDMSGGYLYGDAGNYFDAIFDGLHAKKIHACGFFK